LPQARKTPLSTRLFADGNFLVALKISHYELYVTLLLSADVKLTFERSSNTEQFFCA
jgi:hypothetical protein